jgi:hypothetical protein
MTLSVTLTKVNRELLAMFQSAPAMGRFEGSRWRHRPVEYAESEYREICGGSSKYGDVSRSANHNRRTTISDAYWCRI